MTVQINVSIDESLDRITRWVGLSYWHRLSLTKTWHLNHAVCEHQGQKHEAQTINVSNLVKSIQERSNQWLQTHIPW